MCARYETLPDGLPEPFSETRLAWFSPRLSEVQREMFPGYLGPVLRLRGGEPGLDAMRWGLIPFWARDLDPRKHRLTFNARAETIDKVASFREPFQRRRCLVPASCFFEFPMVEGRKVRHRVYSAIGPSMVFAGVWDRCRRAGEEIYSYTIITTDPVDGLRWLHHRLPVVLSPEAQREWMDPASDPRRLKALLVSPGPNDLAPVPDE